MRCSLAAATRPSISVGLTSTLTPIDPVPGLPGAMKISPTFGDCESFHATACSRPPLPTIMTRSLTLLLPFDRAGRLGRDVEDDPVDAVHFVHDAVGHACDQFVRQACPVRRHGVVCYHRANRDRIPVGAEVAH